MGDFVHNGVADLLHSVALYDFMAKGSGSGQPGATQYKAKFVKTQGSFVSDYGAE